MKKLLNKFPGSIVRFGFVTRGILYLLTGFYGTAAVIGLSANPKDATEIIKTLGTIPFGNIILLAIFVGCVGYGVWGLIRASRPGVLITRIGYLSSGLWYLVLSILPIQLFLRITVSKTTFGPANAGLFIVLIGVIIIIGGAGQIVYGYRKSFKKTLKTIKSERQEYLLLAVGKYGYIARGVTFVLLGTSFVLGKAPGGPVLLGIISIGLMALGAYSIIASRIVKLKTDDE